MVEFNVYKIRFINNDKLFVSIVLAESVEEAITKLENDYKEYDIEIEIEETELVYEKGVALTWHQPL